MSSVPCSSSIRFLYWLLSFIDVDTLLALGVECLLPRHGGATIQSRAYSNSSDEGQTKSTPSFRSSFPFVIGSRFGCPPQPSSVGSTRRPTLGRSSAYTKVLGNTFVQ